MRNARRIPHGTLVVPPDAGGASRDRTGDLLVANQTLSQLSYGPLPEATTPLERPRTHAPEMVGLGGVEPPTSPLSGVRSNQLSYRPGGQRRVVQGGHQRISEQVTCDGDSQRRLRRGLFKGGDPAARSRTATLLRLHPSH